MGWAPSRAANEAVLTAIESGLLNPAVLITAVDRLADELSGEHPVLSSAMEQEPAQVEAELGRLTSAIAAGGGEPASLVRAIRQREEDGYRFTGTGTMQPIVAGLVPHNLASPTGFEPVFWP